MKLINENKIKRQRIKKHLKESRTLLEDEFDDDPEVMELQKQIAEIKAKKRAEKEEQDRINKQQEEDRIKKEQEVRTQTIKQQREEGKKILDQILEDEKRSENAWFDRLVPDSGKADTEAGEMIRAINRIIYRDRNDGDYFYKGYGKETAGDAASYLAEYNNELKDLLIDIAENDETDTYSEDLEEVEYQIKEIIKQRPELLVTPNEVDMYEAGNGEDYWDDYAPTYEYDVDTWSEDLRELDDWESFGNWLDEIINGDSLYRNARINQYARDGFSIENLSEEAYNELDQNMNTWIQQYVDDVKSDYDDEDEE